MEINIEGVDKAKVLAVLYNNSQPLGMGFLHYTPDNMPIEDAQNLLKEHTYFDYLKGRVMKIDLSTNVLRTDLYDRDNGDGAAYRVLKEANLIKEETNATIE